MPIITAVSSPTTALITSTSDASGNISYVTANTTAMVIDTNQNTTHTGYVSAPNTFGYKNRIMNGDMRIDQRNAGASLTPVNSTSDTADRWRIQASQASKFTVQQMNGVYSSASNYEASSTPTNFVYSIKATSSGSYSPGSGEIFGYYQGIENLNVMDLNWGTSAALPVTLSFWTKASLTGLYSGAIQQGPSTRNYPFSFTINAANTWQYVTITIPGDVTGAWANQHLYVFFTLSSGATALTTGGAWVAGSGNGYHGVTGTTNVLGTSGATFYLTGVQLEKGTVATPFDYRDYGNELRMCQRYYQYLGGSTASGDQYLASGMCNTSTQARFSYIFPVPMRTSPSVTFSSVSNFLVYSGAVTATATAIVNPGVVDYRYMAISATVSSGLTAGYGAILLGENTTSSAIQISAEL